MFERGILIKVYFFCLNILDRLLMKNSKYVVWNWVFFCVFLIRLKKRGKIIKIKVDKKILKYIIELNIIIN